MKIIPAILFDFDGTLVNSENIWLEAKIQALQKMDICYEENKLREFAGQNLNTVFSHFFTDSEVYTNRKNLHELKKIFHQTVDDLALNLMPNHLKEIEGAREVLSQFKGAGFVIAICSNAPIYFIETTLSFLKFDEFTGGIFSTTNTDKGKPNPFVYHKAIDTLGLNKDQLLPWRKQKWCRCGFGCENTGSSVREFKV